MIDPEGIQTGLKLVRAYCASGHVDRLINFLLSVVVLMAKYEGGGVNVVKNFQKNYVRTVLSLIMTKRIELS